jgi:hypothetical protein
MSAYKLEVHISKLFYDVSLVELQGTKKDYKFLADAGFISSQGPTTTVVFRD